MENYLLFAPITRNQYCVRKKGGMEDWINFIKEAWNDLFFPNTGNRTFLNTQETDQFYKQYVQCRKELGVSNLKNGVEKITLVDDWNGLIKGTYLEEPFSLGNKRIKKPLYLIDKFTKPGIYKSSDLVHVKPMVECILEGSGGITSTISGYADAVIPKGSMVGLEGSRRILKIDHTKLFHYVHSITTNDLRIEKIHLDEPDLLEMYSQHMKCYLKTDENKPNFGPETRNPENRSLIVPGLALKDRIRLAKFYYSTDNVQSDKLHIYVGFTGGISFLVRELYH